jgi:hypothetical protein
MSHCRDFEEALWEAAEGRPLSAEAEAHLRSCESCRAAVGRLSVASRGFDALRAVEAPDPSAAVWQRLRRPVRRPARRPAFALAWAAGAVACIVAGTFALRHRPAPQPPAPVAPMERIAKAPEVPPVAASVRPGEPAHPSTSTAEVAQPVKLSGSGHKHHEGGGGRLASTHRNPSTVKQPKEQQPQTQVAEAPPAGEMTSGGTAGTLRPHEAAALACASSGEACRAAPVPRR